MIPKKRAILNDVLSRTPDKPLYHYTTQTGLLGIIKSREIWATHTQYLNDRREFLHALDLVHEEITRLLDEAITGEWLYRTDEPGRARQQILLRMQQAVSMSPESINVCVCSFSEERDSLSQWRSYGGSSGFAIGFSGELLKAATEEGNGSSPRAFTIRLSSAHLFELWSKKSLKRTLAVPSLQTRGKTVI